MSRSATSLFVFGIYLIFLGLGFLVMPNTILPVFGLPTTSEPWIRIMAVLLLALAYYYIQTARQELTFFIRLTVHARVAVIVFFTALVVLGLASPILILFGAIDLLAALWTAWALRVEGHAL